MKNHYQVLGVSEGASQDQIEKRYLLLSHIWDPKKVVGEKQREEVRKKFQRIEDAYEVLSHPEKRKAYDRKLSSRKEKDEKDQNSPDKQTAKSKSTWKEQRPSSWVSDVPSQSSSRASTQTTSKPTTRCEYCRANSPTKKVTFHENVGMIFRRRHRKVSGKLCKNCINSFFWNLTGRTMLLGWWGTISFFVTLFILINNFLQFIFTLGMSKRSLNKSQEISPFWVFTTLAGYALITYFIYNLFAPGAYQSGSDFDNSSSSASRPRPTSTRSNSVSSASVPKPTNTPLSSSSYCYHWSEITRSMAGREVCVYGEAFRVYKTGQAATRIKFSSQPNTFFMYSVNYVFEGLGAGDCVAAEEKIQLWENQIPFMEINELYDCEP